MIKQTKKFWFLYISFTIILSISLYKITVKQINYKEIETQELNIRKLVSLVEISNNENTEIINPPDEPQIEPDENSNSNIEANDYWDYINTPLISVDFNSLINKNNDTVAWVK